MLSQSDNPSKAADSARIRAVEADEERALIERARELDNTAWAALYERHAEQVYAYIYYRLGTSDAAEDLTADVFVKAVAGIKGYSYRGTPLLAWLYRSRTT